MSARILKYLRDPFYEGLEIKYVEEMYDIFSQRCLSVELKGFVAHKDLFHVFTTITNHLMKRFRLTAETAFTNERNRVYLRYKLLPRNICSTGTEPHLPSGPETSGESDGSNSETTNPPRKSIKNKTISDQKNDALVASTKSSERPATDLPPVKIQCVKDKTESDTKTETDSDLIPAYSKIEQLSKPLSDKRGLGFKPMKFVKSTTADADAHVVRNDAELLEAVRTIDISKDTIKISEKNFDELKMEIKTLRALNESQRSQILLVTENVETLKKENKLLKDTHRPRVRMDDYYSRVMSRKSAILRNSSRSGSALTMRDIRGFIKFGSTQPLEIILIEFFALLVVSGWTDTAIYDLTQVVEHMDFSDDSATNVELLLAIIRPTLYIMGLKIY